MLPDGAADTNITYIRECPPGLEQSSLITLANRFLPTTEISLCNYFMTAFSLVLFLFFPGRGTSLLEANGDVPLDGVAFSRLN